MDYLYIIIGGVLSGICGSLGIGGGGVLIIFLSLVMGVPQLTAQGINLMFFIPVAILSVVIYGKKGMIKFRSTFVIIVSGLVGIAAGIPVGNLIGNGVLSKLYGGVLVVISLKEFFKKEKPTKKSV